MVSGHVHRVNVNRKNQNIRKNTRKRNHPGNDQQVVAVAKNVVVNIKNVPHHHRCIKVNENVKHHRMIHNEHFSEQFCAGFICT